MAESNTLPAAPAGNTDTAASAAAPAASGAAPANPQSPAAPLVDVAAEVQKALAARNAEFAQQLKDLTGQESLEALRDARLAEKGDDKKLLEIRTTEIAQLKAKYEQAQIGNAILAAAGDAVDPAVVLALLGSQAAVAENGAVTIDGKPVKTAVADLLKEKLFLAKPAGGAGGGAPANGGGGDGDVKAQYEAAKAKGDIKSMLALKARLPASH